MFPFATFVRSESDPCVPEQVSPRVTVTKLNSAFHEDSESFQAQSVSHISEHAGHRWDTVIFPVRSGLNSELSSILKCPSLSAIPEKHHFKQVCVLILNKFRHPDLCLSAFAYHSYDPGSDSPIRNFEFACIR